MPVLELNEKYKGKILDLLINPQKIEKFKKKRDKYFAWYYS